MTVAGIQTYSITEWKLLAKAEEQKEARKEEYDRVMILLETSRESPADRETRLARQEKEARKKKDQTRKANELRSRIAFWRSRAMADRADKSASANLAMAKTQLYWVLNPMSSEGI